MTALSKGFGRRQAYESLRGTNPRPEWAIYGDFDFPPGLAEARGPVFCADRAASMADFPAFWWPFGWAEGGEVLLAQA